MSDTDLSYLSSVALFARSHKAIAAGRRANAVAVARAVARALANTTSIIELANILALAGELAEARALLAPLAERDPGWPTAILGTIAIREGRLHEAAALLRRYEAACPSDRMTNYRLASVLPHLGNFEETNRRAARGTLLQCGNGQLTSLRILRFPDPCSAIEPCLPFARQLWYEAPSTADIQAVYLVGCDSRYFLLFGEALARSLSTRAGARLLLHVHLVNPEPMAEELLERLQRKRLLPIICSRESIEFSGFSEGQRRAYLSCARYLVLPELLRRYAKPILVADADQLVVTDLRRLLADLSAHDVALLRDDAQVGNIFSLVSASVFAASPSPGGERFVRTLRTTIAERMSDPAALSWHLDQAALAVAHLLHPRINTLRLPRRVMDSIIDPGSDPDSIHPEALFWSITMSHEHNLRKLDTALFRQFFDIESSPAVSPNI